MEVVDFKGCLDVTSLEISLYFEAEFQLLD
jgi:hypothetical protein